MKMVIAGGGTGGHLSPALALGEALVRMRPETEVLFAGTRHGLDKDFFTRAGVRYELLDVGGLRGRGPLSAAAAALKMARATLAARRLLARERPALVVGVGGFASVPPALAALSMRIPLLLLEQNTRPGLANRLLARFASRVCVGFEEGASRLPGARVEVTGNPVRFEAIHSNNEQPEKFSILVLGGSSGAKRVNKGAVNNFKTLGKTVIKLKIEHQTGNPDWEAMRATYKQFGIEAEVVPFIHEMAPAYARADLVVARSGAMTVTEVALAGKPAIFVPYPFHRDHQQEHNARAMERLGAAVVVQDDEHLSDNLARVISELMTDRARLAEMARRALAAAKPRAAERIAQSCFELAESRPAKKAARRAA